MHSVVHIHSCLYLEGPRFKSDHLTDLFMVFFRQLLETVKQLCPYAFLSFYSDHISWYLLVLLVTEIFAIYRVTNEYMK